MTTLYDADVIVVGSGVLGSLVGYDLAKAGKAVIILEAGPRVQRSMLVESFRRAGNWDDPNAPYPDIPWAPAPHSKGYLQQKGPVEYSPNYLRLVGGTTWHWAGASWRFLPNDFKLNAIYGQGRDWPISYDDLEPFYHRAELELGVMGLDEEDQRGQGGTAFPPRSAPYPLDSLPFDYMDERVRSILATGGFHMIHEPSARASRPYDGRPACCGNNNCMAVCPTGAQYCGEVHVDKAERCGAKLIDNAVVFSIEVGEQHKIAAIHYRTPDGLNHRLTARSFIVAANGIETPKLFLISPSSSSPDGVANSSGMVGRNLMDHPGTQLVILAKEPLWPGRGPVQMACILDMRDGSFRAQHSAIKHSLRNQVPNYAITKRLLERGVVGPELDQTIRYQAARWLDFTTVYEQLPVPQNRIIPSTEKVDALNIPVPELHYDVDSYVAAGAEVAINVHYQRFTELLGTEIINIHRGWQNRDHIMGTTIMGNDPRNSVVDGECRTHDHPNLFVASTSVMPAVAVANPTLTGAALSLRIAQTVIREI